MADPDRLPAILEALDAARSDARAEVERQVLDALAERVRATQRMGWHPSVSLRMLLASVRADIKTLQGLAGPSLQRAENPSLAPLRAGFAVMREASMPPLAEIIDYLESTPEESWWAGPTFRSPCGTQHCVLAHVEDRWGAPALEWFEARWSTSYVIGGVNDGTHPGYPQPTAKARSLAFLRALAEGREEDTQTAMDRQDRAWQESGSD